MAKHTGVYEHFKKNGDIYYKASITFRNKHISLGSYHNSIVAKNAYLLARKIIESPLINVNDYQKKYELSFEKWVVLINYRDHNYYFKNPIYMHQHYFSYFISTSEELFFDIDDLFYYANHKIHKRNGYYFINDYGMQINLLTRYGVKNHAVINRDYTFVDHDDCNYRYDNIKIINPYYGVIQMTSLKSTTYKSKININGTYVIGYYDTLNEAAIAYNKAVDLLNENSNSSKLFPKNYIIDLNSKAYVDIYNKVNISKKILALVDKANI